MSDSSTFHQALVERLRQMKYLCTPAVEAAFRAIPRHLFLPDMPLEKVYQDKAIITKRINCQPVSSSSQPAMMAIMLEQLNLQAGQSVLEIGAGTGYNAALMAHIVGNTGRVVALDIDEDIVKKAQRHLAAAGFERVQVICKDGSFGYLEAAPYDRIILTVGTWDIAPWWQAQLKPDGLLLLPLTVGKNLQLSVVFRQAEGYLESVSTIACGFMKLRGAFAEPQMVESRRRTMIGSLRRALAQICWLLPLPGEMKLRCYNQVNFGKFSLEGLQIRAYPHHTNYTPEAKEWVIVKRWTKLVLSWH